jgi:hypothetical protein
MPSLRLFVRLVTNEMTNSRQGLLFVVLTSYKTADIGSLVAGNSSQPLQAKLAASSILPLPVYGNLRIRIKRASPDNFTALNM